MASGLHNGLILQQNRSHGMRSGRADLTAQRRVGNKRDLVPVAEFEQFFFRQPRMRFDLIARRSNTRQREDLLEQDDVEVSHTDCPHFAGLHEGFHGSPSWLEVGGKIFVYDGLW